MGSKLLSLIGGIGITLGVVAVPLGIAESCRAHYANENRQMIEKLNKTSLAEIDYVALSIAGTCAFAGGVDYFRRFA
jgi:hypothetical protein